MRAFAFAALLAAVPCIPALAQDAACVVPPFRGVTTAAGASAVMTVRNDGKTCNIRLLADTASNTPFTSMDVTERPQNGEVTIASPYIRYKPKPGFTGSDHFAVAVTGTSAQGRPANGSIKVAVTVTP